MEDLLEIAIRIEREGVSFYRRLYEQSSAPQAREIFSLLAAEEERHLGTFRQMLDQIATYTPRYSYPGEYGAFIDGVSTRLIEQAQKVAHFSTATAATALVDAALSLESETLLFYMDCAQHADNENLKQGIQIIIVEEKRHWMRLQDLKQELLKA